MIKSENGVQQRRNLVCVGVVFGEAASAVELDHCLRLAARLQAEGAAVVSFCADNCPAVPRLKEAGLTSRRLHGRSRSALGIAANAVRLARICRREGIDVLSVHDLAGHRAAVMASALGSPAAVARTFHGPGRLPVNLFTEWTLARTSQVLAVSEWVLSSLGPLGAAVDSQSKHIVAPGVDAQIFSPERRSPSLREQWGAKPDDFVVGLPVVNGDADGVLWFLNAALALKTHAPTPRWVLLDFDGGESVAHGIELARRMGLSDRFRAITKPGDRPAALASLDLVVIPSSGWESSLNLALESMASETAPIAADHGGMGEIVTHGQTGMLASRGDSRALADAIVYMLDNRPFRRIMARAARDHAVGGFSHDKWFHSTQAVLRAAAKLPMNASEDVRHEESGRIAH